MPVCLHLRLLHAWRNVLHGAEGEPNANAASVWTRLWRQPNASGRCLFLFGVAAGDVIDVGFTRGHAVQPAAGKNRLFTSILDQSWRWESRL
jgi:hypothetical protein